MYALTDTLYVYASDGSAASRSFIVWIHSKEPYMHSKDRYVNSIEPCTYLKETSRGGSYC